MRKHSEEHILAKSQANFFFHRPTFMEECPHLKEAFSDCSQEILQFLDEEDIMSLKFTNKFFNDLCECHILFAETMKSLGSLFAISVEAEEQPKKKSKFKEKFNFNKPIGVYYKPPEKYVKSIKRVQSAKVRNIPGRVERFQRYEIKAMDKLKPIKNAHHH